MYAEVAVHTPMARRLVAGNEPVETDADALGTTFFYTVPPELSGAVQPGHLAWVPFGKQELQGLVLGLQEEPPPNVMGIRSLLDLVMPEPVCTMAQLELARWLSRTCLASILDCLLIMLPAGLVQKAEPVLSLSADARMALVTGAGASGEDRSSQDTDSAGRTTVKMLATRPQQMAFDVPDFTTAAGMAPYFPRFADLKAEQHALLALLIDNDYLPERVLSQRDPALVRPSVVNALVEKGLVNRRRRIVEPVLRPKRGKQVALIANEETVAQRLPTLGRASKQADALAWLADHGDPPPTVETVCAAVDCSPAPLYSLADRGWVEIIPERRWLELLLTPEQVAVAQENELRRAPAQVAALTALQDMAAGSDGRVDESALRSAHDVAPATVAALERRDFLRRTVEKSVVRLLLDGEQVVERLIELRGGEKYRPVLATLAGEAEPVWLGWLYAETGTNLATLRELADAGLISLVETEMWRDPLAGKEFVADRAPALTADQARVWQEIERDLRDLGLEERAPTFLLHGVTGSGKTEIYLRAIDAVLASERQAIALVPEIALTPQTVRRFAARFGERVTVYHSGLSAGERYDVWRKARSGEIDVVVGTRSALFLPMPRLGLIVLDEEHDPSYKEAQRSPRYHAREAALRLAQETNAAVILGSATPSLEAYHATQLGKLRLLVLPRRIMGHARAIAEQQKRLHLQRTVYRPVDALSAEARYAELPPVQVVDLRQELRAGNRSIFSRALEQSLTDVLKAKQQAILFLNRRGSATFVMCRDCGHVQTCEYCDVPLTYHERIRQAGKPGLHKTSRTASTAGQSRAGAFAQLVCHHCGRRVPSPERCPECDSRRIRYLGAGTEKIAELVQTMWPAARVVRWDRDVTGRKGSHDAILEQFASGKADVMVGTQMIAKGLDLPLVTLVGVISADVGLYLPDFRAAERVFQLLTQVAGRAGRSLLGGRVILQSYRPEHYVIQAARRHDYLDFYRQELSFRRQLGYPPFRRLAKLVYLHGDQERARSEAEALARALTLAIHEHGPAGADLIGPAPCFFGRERGKFRWQIVLRAVDPAAFLRMVDIPRGWRVDVDPVTML